MVQGAVTYCSVRALISPRSGRGGYSGSSGMGSGR